MFDFSPNTTHTFLEYAENAHLSNEKVLQLIDDLRDGLSREETLQSCDHAYRLYTQKQKNVMTCYCIMLHVLCLADLSEDREQYDQFLGGWNTFSAA